MRRLLFVAAWLPASLGAPGGGGFTPRGAPSVTAAPLRRALDEAAPGALVEEDAAAAGADDALCDRAGGLGGAPTAGAAHYFLEASACPAAAVDSAAALAEAMRGMGRGVGAPSEAGATQKEFTPQGVTILHLLSAGHLTVHTWPEHGAALFDFLAPTSAIAPPGQVEQILRTAATRLGCARTALHRHLRGPGAEGSATGRGPTPRQSLAKHVLVDLAGCPADRLAGGAALLGSLDAVVGASNLTEVGTLTRWATAAPERGGPVAGAWAGSSHAAKLLEESHAAVHALPAVGRAYLDLMTCAPLSPAQVAEIEHASRGLLGCASVATTLWERGF